MIRNVSISVSKSQSTRMGLRPKAHIRKGVGNNELWIVNALCAGVMNLITKNTHQHEKTCYNAMQFSVRTLVCFHLRGDRKSCARKPHPTTASHLNANSSTADRICSLYRDEPPSCSSLAYPLTVLCLCPEQSWPCDRFGCVELSSLSLSADGLRSRRSHNPFICVWWA